MPERGYRGESWAWRSTVAVDSVAREGQAVGAVEVRESGSGMLGSFVQFKRQRRWRNSDMEFWVKGGLVQCSEP